MSARGGELVATDEPAVISKPFLGPIVVEDGQGNGCFPDPPWADESDWCEIFCEADDLLDQFVATETGPRSWGRWFSRCTRCKYEVLAFLVVKTPNLVWAWVIVNIFPFSMD